MAHGMDQMYTGLGAVVSGYQRKTLSEHLLQKAGMSPEAAYWTNNGVSVAAVAGGALAISGTQSAAAAATSKSPEYVAIGKGLGKLRTVNTGRLQGFVRGNSQMSGGIQNAKRTFIHLVGRQPAGPFDRIVLSDGREIVYREISKSGTAKIEIVDPTYKFLEKVSFLE